jgi:hypothetical protein
MAHVPDGVFNIRDGILEFIGGPQRTVEELEKLDGLIRAARAAHAKPEELTQQIGSLLPEVGAALSVLIPKDATAFWTFMLVLSLWIQYFLDRNREASPQTVINQPTINVYQQAPNLEGDRNRSIGKSGAESRLGSLHHRQERMKPNSPCSCGSGKKYKKCHGAGAGQGR